MNIEKMDNMERKKIRKEIFSKFFNSDSYNVRAGDLPTQLDPTDIIEIRREEAYYSENNSYDAYTELVIFSEREETDDEYATRLAELEKDKERMKRLRYKNYLRLKAEFDGIDFETIKKNDQEETD